MTTSKFQHSAPSQEQMLIVAKRLIEERVRLGHSQAGLATALRIGRTSIHQYESGRTLPGSYFLMQAAALGVDAGYVLTGNRAADCHQSSQTAPAQATTTAQTRRIHFDLTVKYEGQAIPGADAAMVKQLVKHALKAA